MIPYPPSVPSPQVKSTIAQGGFSYVYLARCTSTSRQFALKHIVCADKEALDVVRREVAVLVALRGHPNIISLHAHALLESPGGVGRQEVFLLFEYCEKGLCDVLEGTGGKRMTETELLVILRDVCNALYSLHCQIPPIAHR